MVYCPGGDGAVDNVWGLLYGEDIAWEDARSGGAVVLTGSNEIYCWENAELRCGEMSGVSTPAAKLPVQCGLQGTP